MKDSEYHIPVLLHAATDALINNANGNYVDLTFGGGGHSRVILDKINNGKLVAFDHDQDALVNSIDDQRFQLIRQNFRNIENILEENGLWNNHGSIINSIRSLDWVDGFQFFSYGTWREKNYFIEAGKSFFKNKTKINNWSGSDNKPPAPTLTINNIDPFINQLTTYQREPNGDPNWIVLYRTSNNPDPSSSEIINIQFSNNVSVFIDTISDLT